MQLLKRSFAIIILIGIVAAASGCRSTIRLADLPDSRPSLFPAHSLGQIRYQMAVVPDTIQSFDSRSEVRYVSPDMKGSFSLHIRQLRADTLAIGVSIHRIRVARALVTADSFFVYDRIKKDLYFNSTEAALRHLGMPLTLSDVGENLLGTLDVPTGRGWQVRADTSYYYVTNAQRGASFTIDPRIWRVTRYELRNEDGEVVERREFDSFDQFGNAFLPRKVTITRPLDEQYLSVYHRSLVVNPDELDLSFQTSDNPTRIVFP